MVDDVLTATIIGSAMKVHNTLGPGFLESIYTRALTHELRRAGMEVKTEYPIDVWYEEAVVGKFAADMLVESRIIVEIKAVHRLARIHHSQIVNYLVATGIDIGLLLNFGTQRLEFKRKVRTLSGSAIG